MKARLAVLISGRGSNMESLIKACAEPDYPAEIALVISNNPDAKGLDTANSAGIKTIVHNHRDYKNARDQYDQKLDELILSEDIDYICLAGFMRILGADFINKWPDKIINIHPSLLPAFPGLNTHERAIESNMRYHGCTVHIVRPKLDCGPILAQKAVNIQQDDTADKLAARVLKQEHKIYPMAVKKHILCA